MNPLASLAPALKDIASAQKSSFSATQAVWRFLNNEKVTFQQLLQAFVNAMYQDEASQLEAMCRYIKVNGLISALKNKDWKAFARGYNGPAFAKNNYDVKLANAYKKWSQ